MTRIILVGTFINLYIFAYDNGFSQIEKGIINEYNTTSNYPKIISNEKKKLVDEANNIFEDTATAISRLTHNPYIVEASAVRASIAIAKMGKIIPVKYRDDLGRVGFMKDKPIIATAKKFLEFMKKTHKGEIVKIDNPKTYKNLCQKICGKQGLYIMRTEEHIGYKLTGFILPWDKTDVLEEQNYVQYAKEIWLFVDSKNK